MSERPVLAAARDWYFGPVHRNSDESVDVTIYQRCDHAPVVDLTGLQTDPEPALGDISAQLVWTLRQVGIRTVEVRVDGRPVRLEGVPAEQTTDPSIRGPDVQQRTEAVIERLGLGARCGLLRQQLVPVDDGRGNVDEFAVRDTRLVA